MKVKLKQNVNDMRSIKNTKRTNKKASKARLVENTALKVVGWNTTDADELERRRIRGKTENFRVQVCEKKHPCFGSFSITSVSKNSQYHVEIRSLSERLNSCNCPDYLNNGLGTCKHIEHFLYRFQKRHKKQFETVSITGSSRIEIFMDRRENPVVKILWPKNMNVRSSVRQLLEPYFSTDGSLLEDMTIAYPKLLNTIISLKDKKHRNQIRISSHMEDIVEARKRFIRKDAEKSIFLADIKQGKRSLNFMKFPLYSYQEQGLLHLVFTERGLLADEMGLGKTVQAIGACALLYRLKKVERVVVVATASLKTEWLEQICKFTDLPYQIIQGNRKDRLKQYQTKTFFYLTNYEQIVMDGSEIQHLISPDVIILDEAQRIKNWHTKTANAVKQLRSRYAFVLTGTPLENRIDDIYSVVQFLDPNVFGPLFRFNRDFYQLDEKGRPIGYKNLDVLHQRLRPIMLRRRKGDVEGELPERTTNNYFVGMDKEQQIRYEEYENRVARLMSIAKNRPLKKEEHEKLQIFLACMRMLCDTPYILDPKCRISPKLRELENILEELLLDKTTKIIIFSEWERMLQLVRELAQKMNLGFAWHTGTVPQHKRRQEINRFKEHSECRLFLSTDSGSVGLNLQAANVVVNLDLPWNPAKLEQRIARAWRKHQTRSVQVINFVCEHSIEHRMLGLLSQKQMLATGVLEGGDELKEMDLPSGRQAFMERLGSLLSPTVVTNIAPTTEFVTEPEKPILPALIKQVQEGFVVTKSEDSSVLDIIDSNTFETIQRLIDLGILSLNPTATIVPTTEALSISLKQKREKQIKEARQLLLQAERKLRMAQILIEQDFLEESIIPLKNSLEFTVNTFKELIDLSETPQKELLSKTLVQYNKMKEINLEANSIQIKKFSIDCQNFYQEAYEKLEQFISIELTAVTAGLQAA